MREKVLDWFGFGTGAQSFAGHGHSHGSHGHDHGEGGHGHTHGVIDPMIATTSRGIWAIKWSFVLLALTAAAQLVIVFLSGSVALLADTIHNVGDAVTAIPLWVAFLLARRKPSRTFTYGLGRVEDIAGLFIVAIILFSALVAGYQSINRLINPEPISHLGWVFVAGLIGFVGNEVVAVFRIRVGREISSAALIADGYHARTDGFTSLAVVLGAAGVWAGFPLADPIVGLLITAAIFGIVWQSARAVLTRMLDGVEPGILEEIDHAAEHVSGVIGVHGVQARWLGHKLYAELSVHLDESATVAEAQEIVSAMKAELFAHLPVLAQVSIRIEAPATSATASRPHRHDNPHHGHHGHSHPPSTQHGDESDADGHHHAPDPVVVTCDLADGLLEIVNTPEGERMRLTIDRHAEGLTAMVVIDRPNGLETLFLAPDAGDHHRLQSLVAPDEPHEFDARLVLQANGKSLDLPFRMTEPEVHGAH
ncbi:MAG: cobalt transporter [Rhodobacterales bacterium 65-51]|uniref:cation diffusion facilitator family transporter n=1 Tax=uncultured Gemmobacter sp. TaxID=1095917 RepID=UPI00095A4B7B|nr:cation diffusion facilitator family transporter [uncultured Gemmobacter sp.]OJY28851.1 MAG: cobalt transporter [Rhodobacterales bacterium 65-51]